MVVRRLPRDYCNGESWNVEAIGGHSGGRPSTGALLVGVAALELGFPVLTVNLRHFRLIPGLKIVQL